LVLLISILLYKDGIYIYNGKYYVIYLLIGPDDSIVNYSIPIGVG